MDLDRYPLTAETPEGLLDRLQEECAEVIKACSKAKRFGLGDYGQTTADPVSDEQPRPVARVYNNARQIANELADVLEIRDHLFNRGILPNG